MKLELKDLTVILEKQPILKSLSLCMEEGEFLALLGPSGCGKSTLLKTVAGIHPASGGSILLDGQEITLLPPHKRGAVIVFQDIRLFPHMDVADNIAFPLKMSGVPKAQRRAKAKELLAHVHLTGYEDRQIASLSGGEQQRVALARALSAEPKLLLLDEPFSALDENLREEMRRLVKELHGRFGMTTIMVTHDRQEALSMADRVAVMFAGEIVQCDLPQQVYHHPASRRVADYFGDCAYLSGSVENGAFCSEGITFATDREAGKYDLMLRADALTPDENGPLSLTVTAMEFYGACTLVTLMSQTGTVWKKPFSEPPKCALYDRLSFRADLSRAVLFPKDE